MLSISKPSTAHRVDILVTHTNTLQLENDPDAILFERTGNDLSLVFDNGGQIVLQSFFAPGEDDALPSFTLPDGSTLPAKEFLSAISPEMDLTTAAGPGSNTVAGSGAGEYADDSGALLDGVDRLGALGGLPGVAHSLSESEVPGSGPLAALDTGGDPFTPGPVPVNPDPVNPDPVNPGPGPGPGPEEPEKPGPQPEPGSFAHYTRVVLYDASETGDVIYFRLLDADGKPITDSTLLSAATIAADGQPNFVNLSGFDANGLGTLTLTAAGKAALENGEDIHDTLTIAVAGGKNNIQVVMTPGSEYRAEDESLPEGWPEGAAVTHEWHTETNGSGTGVRVTGDTVDEMFFSNEIAGFTNTDTNFVPARNTATVTVATGTGEDTVNITGGKYGVHTQADGPETKIILSGAGTLNITGSGAAPESKEEGLEDWIVTDEWGYNGEVSISGIRTEGGTTRIHADDSGTGSSLQVQAGVGIEEIQDPDYSLPGLTWNVQALTASNGGTNEITGIDTVNLESAYTWVTQKQEDGYGSYEYPLPGTTVAMHAGTPGYADEAGSGGTNTITGAASVTLTSTVDGSAGSMGTGMYAGVEYYSYDDEPGNLAYANAIQAKDVEITVTGTSTASSGEMQNGPDIFAMRADKHGTNTITGTDSEHFAGSVTLTSTLEETASASLSGNAYGMYASGGTIYPREGSGSELVALGNNNIQNVEKVTIDVENQASGDAFSFARAPNSNGNNTAAMYSDYGTNTISNVGTVDIDASAVSGSVYGLHAEINGTNSVDAKALVSISSIMGEGSTGTAAGVYAGGSTWGDDTAGHNIIHAGTVTLEAVNNGTGNAYAMQALGDGANTIHLQGEGNSITATAADGAAYAMYAHGENTNNSITGSDQADTLIISGDVAIDGNGSLNSVYLDAGNDTITLDGTIYQGALTLDAGDDTDTLVLKAADAQEFAARYHDWFTGLSNEQIANMHIENLESEITASDYVATELSWLWYRLGEYNKNFSEQQISLRHVDPDNTLIRIGNIDTLKNDDYGAIIVNGLVSESATLHAGTSKLILQAGSIDVFNANYKSWLTSNASAVSGRTLTVEQPGGWDISSGAIAWLHNLEGVALEFRGDGDSMFSLDQAVDGGDFAIAAGDGHDVLILHAATVAECTDRYKDWLQNDASLAGLEVIKLAVPDLSAPDMKGLIDTVAGYVDSAIAVTGDGGTIETITGSSFIGAENYSYIVDLAEMNGDAVTLKNGYDAIRVAGDVAHSFLDTGAGNDTVTIGGSFNSGTIDLGKGDNTVHVLGSVGSNTEITASDGNDTVIVDGSAWGESINLGGGDNSLTVREYLDSNITTGDGNDTVIVDGSAWGESITLGGGDNFLTVRNSLDADVTAGDGDDTVTVGHAGWQSTITLGGGDNFLTVRDGLGGTVTAGDGNDTITVDGGAWGNINLGGGDNFLTVRDGLSGDVTAGDCKDTVIVDGGAWGDINLGNGDNFLKIHGDINYGTIITTGDGADKVSLDGVVDYSELELGAGNDLLVINDAAVMRATFDGGDGNDTLQIGVTDLNGITGIFQPDDTWSINTFSNFETLVLDLENGTADAVDLDTLLAGYAFEQVYIKSDAGSDAISGESWSSIGTVTYNNATYDVYKPDDANPDVTALLAMATTG